jgi:methionine-gamma-lyase
MLTKFGVEVTLVDFDNIENVKKSIKKNTTIVYFETPCNPTLKVIDIEKVSKLVHQYNKKIKVIVDNTFCSPATQLPRKFGADLIVHSITKFINGHGDLIAGCVCGSQTDIAKVKMEGIKDATGSVMSADDAYMILRGLKTLGIRYDRQSENTLKIAQYLEKSPYVKAVNYPGLESSKYYDLCKKQMSKPCAILSFETSLSFEQTKKFVNNLKVITLAVSLGGVESLIEHPASMTHATYTKEALKKANIALTLIRLAVGIENVDDLINDLEQAFKKAKK